MGYNTIEDIKQANQASGGCWFSHDTMRFFRSRATDPIYPCGDGAYFVTSEQSDYDQPRLYTVRYADPSGRIRTEGEFQAHRTSATARTKARKLAQQGTEPRMPSHQDIA